MAGRLGNSGRQPQATDRMEFTKARLDDLLKSGRPHRQKSVWDTKETGLSVLISRGPKHKRQATVTLRVVYYLKDKPGVPRYVKLGRYPDDYPDFNLKTVRDTARSVRTKAKEGIDPKRKTISGNFAEVVARFVDEHAKHNSGEKAHPQSLRRPRMGGQEHRKHHQDRCQRAAEPHCRRQGQGAEQARRSARER